MISKIAVLAVYNPEAAQLYINLAEAETAAEVQEALDAYDQAVGL